MLNTALILAAGRGERLMPYTKYTPKPMMLIENKPLIEHQLTQLSKAGIQRVFINHAYLGYKIKHYFGQGNAFNLKIEYLPEPPGGLETGGTLAFLTQSQELQEEILLCINGDIYTDYSANTHIQLNTQLNGHLILIHTKPHLPPANFGFSKENHFLTLTPQEYIFSGIAYYRVSALKSLPTGRFSIRAWLFEQIRQKKLTGEIYHGMWHDIGSPEVLKHFNPFGAY